jgi:hypothetical protein
MGRDVASRIVPIDHVDDARRNNERIKEEDPGPPGLSKYQKILV